MKKTILILAIILVIESFMTSCTKNNPETKSMITEKYFDKTSSGQEVTSYRITNSKGEYVEIIDYGATITKICVLDGEGNLRDVALGFDSLEDYAAAGMYAGATIGRVANRISGCKFTLNGVTYNLANNDSGRTSHGGVVGFDKKMYTVTKGTDGKSLTFEMTSPDGDENFPGNLTLKVTFSFDDNSALSINYNAVSNQDTIFSPTNHSYFNLCGHDSGKNVYDTYLLINSSKTTHLGSDFTPTGELVPTSGGVYDFTSFKKIGADIEKEDPQLLFANGYDINFVIDRDTIPEIASCVTLNNTLSCAAFAYSEESKIFMAVETDRPCMQLYTGNFIEDGTKGKDGATYSFRSGFCCETQGYPDAVNKDFQWSMVLKSGETYSSSTVYTFGVLK